VRHKVEFIAGERVHSRNWSQVAFFAPVEMNVVSVGLLWSDEDGGDEPEDRRTSSQARREYEDWRKTEARAAMEFRGQPGRLFGGVVAKLVCSGCIIRSAVQ